MYGACSLTRAAVGESAAGSGFERLASRCRYIRQYIFSIRIHGTYIDLIPCPLWKIRSRGSCLRSIPLQDAIDGGGCIASFQSSCHPLCRYSKSHYEERYCTMGIMEGEGGGFEREK